MNTKKLLSTLLVSLGAFTLVLSSCGKKNPTPEPTAEPTVEPTVQPTLEPTVEPTTEPTVEPTVVPSEPEPTVVPSEPEPTVEPTDPEPTVEPTDPEPTVEPTDPTVEPTPVPTDPTVEPTPGPTDPSVDPILPEETVYDVTFNYDEALDNLTVWTDYAIDGTIAPEVANISENSDIEGRHTAPLATGGLDAGIYFFAVDADGYIIYASYGLGLGYGSPSDGYYHNQDAKDVFDAPYWSLHEKFVPWGANVKPIEHNGQQVNPWTLYDFVIPEGGFVVRGHADEANMKDFWKVLTGQLVCPKATNQTLEGSTTPKALDNFYVSINEDHQLTIRERTEAETKVDGVQEEDTPSMRFEPTADDEPVEYVSIEAVNALEDNATVEGVRGVITHMNGANVTIQDEDGNAILLYDNQLKEGYAVGDTIVLSGTKTTYNGHPEIKSLTSLTKIEKYGRLPAVAAREVTSENVAEAWVIENNYGLFKLVKAQVKESGQNAKVQLGDVEITLYKVHMPETVEVGDYVDVVCSMQAYNDQVQGRTASTADVSRYYNVTVDVDGVDGSVEPAVSAHASGASVTMTAKHEDANYSFSHWEKLVGENWEQVSSDSSYIITVGEVDEEYRAVFTYAAWALLPGTYAQQLELANPTVNGGDASLAVFTTSEALQAALTTSGDNKWVANGWRTTLIVDGEGKVAVLSYNAAYCGLSPTSNFFGAHSSFAEANPAFEIAEDGSWNLVVPQGGFALSMHTNNIDEIFAALGLEKTYVQDKAMDSQRLYYDAANGKVLVYTDEANPDATLNGVINSLSNDSPTVYTSSAESVTLGDYAVAVDASGKVIYASRLVGGYGGPGDGFYHDGSYVVKNGEVCGIFRIHEKFAGWPNTTEIDGVTVNAWTLYDVVVPEGGYIVTGTWAQMAPLMKAIDPAAVEDGNYFEGVADGLFNDALTIEVTAHSKVANVNLVRPEVEVEEGLVWTGTTFGTFVKLEDGSFTATVELNAWNNIIFTYTTAEGEVMPLNYETATLTGLFTAADVNGCDWSKNFYHEVNSEGVDSASLGKFYTYQGGKFVLTFDPSTMTLNAAEWVNPTVYQTVDFSGATVYTDASENVTLGDYAVAFDAEGKLIYASRLVGGYGGPGDGFYHDGSYAVQAGELCGIFQLHEKFAGWPNTTEIDGETVNAWTLYTVVVPEGGMIVTGSWSEMAPIMQAIDAGAVEDGNYFEGVADGKYNNVVYSAMEVVSLDATTAGATVFTGAEGETAALGDYAIALDANGKLIYASRLVGGYGGPGDGFYHDGSYAVQAGELCGIFQLHEKFAGWPNTTEIDGETVNAWTLYTVVVPEGGVIITGTWAQMESLMKAINPNAVEEGNFFEGVDDGIYNEVKFLVK